MKNLLLVFIIMTAFSFYACGQKNADVPASVKTAFSQKFPDATKVKWDKENGSEWEAEFKMDGKKYSANFDNDGKWMETEYEIGKNEIPAIVKATIEKEFTGFKIEESEISETIDGKVFEFNLEKEETDIDVIIDSNGAILKKEMKNEEDEEDAEKEEKGDHPLHTAIFTDEFNIADFTFSTSGKNRYFILEPGYQLILEGKNDDKTVRLEITVLNETRKIGNIETQILEEKEIENG